VSFGIVKAKRSELAVDFEKAGRRDEDARVKPAVSSGER
jgi:hypothetical protein